MNYQFFNDTLDNFNFSANVVSNSLSFVSKENRISREKHVSDSGVSSGPETEISFNDSVFLSESLVVPLETGETNQKAGNVNIKTLPVTSEISQSGNSKKEAVQTLKQLDINKSNFLSFKSQKVAKTISDRLTTEKSDFLESKDLHLVKNKYTENVNNMCNLSSWNLPTTILEKYTSKNLHSMFLWQVECLSNENVFKNYKNFIYSAPTSAGKTLVAEILAIKTLFERKKKVIFILPFVSIVREKMYYFQDLMGSSGIRVEGFMGSYNPPGGFASVQVAICTIEKANNLINRLLEEDTLSDIGAILVDEIHLLGDPHRGYLLELLLTKLIYIAKKKKDILVQIIGMSATLPNLDILAKWLEAELYDTDFRPIPLYEQAVVCGEVFDKDFKLLRKIFPLPEITNDTDNILQLCLETIKDSCSILIFCPTKNWCENLAQQIASAFFKIGEYLTICF